MNHVLVRITCMALTLFGLSALANESQQQLMRIPLHIDEVKEILAAQEDYVFVGEELTSLKELLAKTSCCATTQENLSATRELLNRFEDNKKTSPRSLTIKALDEALALLEQNNALDNEFARNETKAELITCRDLFAGDQFLVTIQIDSTLKAPRPPVEPGGEINVGDSIQPADTVTGDNNPYDFFIEHDLTVNNNFTVGGAFILVGPFFPTGDIFINHQKRIALNTSNAFSGEIYTNFYQPVDGPSAYDRLFISFNYYDVGAGPVFPNPGYGTAEITLGPDSNNPPGGAITFATNSANATVPTAAMAVRKTGNVDFYNDINLAAATRIYRATTTPYIHHTGPTSPVTNIFVGDNAGNTSVTGGSNAGFGVGALILLGSGTNNTACGRNALGAITTGAGNTCIGYNAGVAYASNESNNICIGNYVTVGVGENNTIRIGNTSNTSTYITGISTTNIGTSGNLVGISTGHQLGTAATSWNLSNVDGVSVGTTGDLMGIANAGTKLGTTATSWNLSNVDGVSVGTTGDLMGVTNGGTKLGTSATSWNLAGVDGVSVGTTADVVCVANGGTQLGTGSTTTTYINTKQLAIKNFPLSSLDVPGVDLPPDLGFVPTIRYARVLTAGPTLDINSTRDLTIVKSAPGHYTVGYSAYLFTPVAVATLSMSPALNYFAVCTPSTTSCQVFIFNSGTGVLTDGADFALLLIGI